MTANVALCADDFGASVAINGGILRLAAAQRLTAVSCIVNAAAWADGAPSLAALPGVVQGRVRLGLHFNLTEGRPLSAALARHWPVLPRLPHLLAAAHLRGLPQAALRAELQAQLAAFVQARGGGPSHIDGHQHVHHLPQVREVLLEVLAGLPSVQVRDTGDVRGPGHAFKRLVIERSGGRAMSHKLQSLGRQANTQLLGVYDFVDTDYRRLMQGWLAAVPERGGLVFCHPGMADGATADPIAAARVRELTYLEGEDFEADLYAAGVCLGPDV